MFARQIRQLRAPAAEQHGSVPPIKTAPAHPAAPLPPKTHRVRNFTLLVGLVGATVYGAGAYMALENDTVYDWYTRYLPGGDDLMDFIESRRKQPPVYAAEEVHTLTERAQAKVHTGHIKASQLKAKAAAARDPEPAPSGAAATSAAATSSAPASAAKLGSALSNITGRNFDSTLSPLVKALNQVISNVNSGRANDGDIAQLSGAIEGVSLVLEQRRKHVEDEIQSKLKEQGALLEEHLQETKQQLVDVYNKRLDTEVQAARANVLAEANNRIHSQYIELTNAFAKRIQGSVDKERDGRLANLAGLEKQIKQLETTVVDTANAIGDNDAVVDYVTHVARLRSVVASDEAQPLAPFLTAIRRSLPKDPLVVTALEAIPKDVQEHGVLSSSQLAARFARITPDIRKASLVPSDAGLGGHLASRVLSVFLVPKHGLPEGDDIESVIARTNTYLSQGRTLDAVAEVNSLKGWPKQIAQNWLQEGRKRCELEFLVNVLGEEGTLHSLSQG